MNILILNYEYPPVGGGGGVACQKLAEEYVRKGHSVACVTTQYGNLASRETIKGVEVHRVKVIGKRTASAAGLLSLVSFPLCAYRYTADLCKRQNFDCIHTHFSVPTGPLGVWISKRFQIPNVLSLHGGDVYDPTKKISPHRWGILRKCNEWVFQHTDDIVAQSTMTKKKGETYYRTDKEIAVIPLPYDNVVFESCGRENLGLEKEKRYIVSIGRLVKRKGFALLIRAMQYIENAELLIIGDGPEYSMLNCLVDELKLSERVKLLGAKYGDEKFQYLSNCDVFVLSSVYEPFGIVLQEAMQAGLPIVATCDGGQGDLIEDQVNGLLIPYGDEKKLAESVDYLLRHPEISRQMTEQNLLKIRNYSADRIAGQYLDILKNMQDKDKKALDRGERKA